MLLLSTGSWYRPISRMLLRGVVITTVFAVLLSLLSLAAVLVCLVWLRVIIFGTVLILSVLQVTYVFNFLAINPKGLYPINTSPQKRAVFTSRNFLSATYKSHSINTSPQKRTIFVSSNFQIAPEGGYCCNPIIIMALI